MEDYAAGRSSVAEIVRPAREAAAGFTISL
jgi:hypothetical protein